MGKTTVDKGEGNNDDDDADADAYADYNNNDRESINPYEEKVEDDSTNMPSHIPDVSQISVRYGYVLFGAPDQGQTLDVFQRSDDLSSLVRR
jgi:hypothetical protein